MNKVSVRFKSRVGGENFVKNYLGEEIESDKGDKFTYTDNIGDGETVTTLTVGDDYLRVETVGAYFAEYEYFIGKKFVGEMRTECGAVPIEIRTDKLEIERRGVFVRIKAEYECNLGGEISRNEFEITIFRRGKVC